MGRGGLAVKDKQGKRVTGEVMSQEKLERDGLRPPLSSLNARAWNALIRHTYCQISARPGSNVG